MNAIKLVAVIALWMGAGAVFSHESAPHHSRAAASVKEQKAWGIAGDAAAAQRTITVRMDDRMRFTPSHITVREGETVRIRAENQGRMLHELVIGTPAELTQHAEMMKKFPGMEHDEPYMSHVPAGRKGEIIWTFNRAGSFQFACLIAGHFDAGMVGTITVAPRP